MKKLVAKVLMAVTMATAIIPVDTQAKVSPTRTVEAVYKGSGKFEVNKETYKSKSKKFTVGAKYTVTLNTKGTAKKSDDTFKKAVLTPSLKKAKNLGGKKALLNCIKTENKINYFLGENFAEEIKMIKGGDSQYKCLDKRAEQDRVYITWEDGVVLNNKGDGKAYYFKAPYNYIGYRGVNGIKKGSVVRTYFVWCTDCNEPDDIIARWDVVLKK